jgi:hypothetical protein
VYVFRRINRAHCCLAGVRGLLCQPDFFPQIVWTQTLVTAGCNFRASTHLLFPVTTRRDGWLLDGSVEGPGDAMPTASKAMQPANTTSMMYFLQQ